jgi:hypothetical protein
MEKNNPAAATKMLFGFRRRNHAAGHRALRVNTGTPSTRTSSTTSNSTVSPTFAVADEMVLVSFTCTGVSFSSVHPATAAGAGAWVSRGRAS